ncbi:vitrin-like [Montipora capricornis]|uniref:vitrin-like n=1 Tax=Montipora foliosa TaxID=591990 RepID=UPI0035F107F3
MPGFGTSLAVAVCLLSFLIGQGSASFWRPQTTPTPTPRPLPSNPNDPYYKTFQKVPAPNVTATKLMVNFLHLSPCNTSSLVKRQAPLFEDIVLVLDGSGSVGKCEFNKGKKALHYMAGLAAESQYDTKYAAVTFATSAVINFNFTHYSIAANKTLQISYPGGLTNTQEGLLLARNLFVNPSGQRPNSREMVFLVTDGQSNVQRQLTVPRATALKKLGVQIFVVAVGNQIHGIDEMVRVATSPPEQFLFRVTKLTQFWEIVKLCIKQVAPEKYKVIQGQFETPCY